VRFLATKYRDEKAIVDAYLVKQMDVKVIEVLVKK